MTRYTLRALAAQWRDWSGTVAVPALAAGLINVCLVHRMTVTRPDVVAAARAAGVDPAELTVPGVSVAFYTAMVTVPVVAVVGQSCVQALRTSWALWRLAGALPRQVPPPSSPPWRCWAWWPVCPGSCWGWSRPSPSPRCSLVWRPRVWGGLRLLRRR